jgi:hypothetical protein
MSMPEKISNSQDRNINIDYLNCLEQQLTELWTQYTAALDQKLDESAEKLRIQYFNLYRRYRHLKKWKTVVSS